MLRKIFQNLKFICVANLAVLLVACAVAQPPIPIPPVAPPALSLKTPPRVALVLGGGGARGMAHVGVLKVLQQEHIPVDLIVGTSAGSIIGSLYAGNPNAYALENNLLQAGLFDLLDVSPSLQGPVSGNALQNYIVKYSRARYFNQLRIPFIAVATDLKTGQAVAFSSGPLPPAVNASAALSPVFRPVQIYGHTYIDGGFTDLIPVDVAQRYHSQVIIAVNIIPDIPRAMPTNIIGVYDRAYLLGDARYAAFNMEGADVILHPNVGQAGLFDSSDKRPLIIAGEVAARRALPQICALLKAKNIHSRCS